MNELIYSFRRNGETVFYIISNRVDIFLPLWYLRAKEDKFSAAGSFNLFSASTKNFCWSMRVEMCLFKSFFLLHSLKTKRALLSATLIGLPWIRPTALDPVINARLGRRCGESPVCLLSSSFFRKRQCEK